MGEEIVAAIERYREDLSMTSQREAERLIDRATALAAFGDPDAKLPRELRVDLSYIRTLALLNRKNRLAAERDAR